MSATKGLGTYGNGVGTVTPLDHKMAQLGLIVKSAANVIRPGLFWDGNPTIVSGKANMSYDVRALSCVLSRGANAGAVLLTNDAVVNVVTTAAPGSNSRYDVVYIWQREFSIDGTDSNPVIGVVQGSAAPSPTVPSLAAFPGAIELARILVPAGVVATNSGTTITQRGKFTAASGGILPFRNTTERDEDTYQEGQLGWLIDSNTFLIYNGTAWNQISPLYAALTKSADQTLTTANTEYAVTFDGELSDIAGLHDNVTNNSRFTVPIAGMYEISYSIYHAQTSGTGYAYLRKNASTPVLGSVDRRAGFTGGTPLRQTLVVALAAGDYVELISSNSVAATLLKGPTNAGVAIEAFGATMSIRYLGPVA